MNKRQLALDLQDAEVENLPEMLSASAAAAALGIYLDSEQRRLLGVLVRSTATFDGVEATRVRINATDSLWYYKSTWVLHTVAKLLNADALNNNFVGTAA